MNRFFYHFSSTSILIPLLFAPFTLLLIFSQNAVPGDLLYPYKRGVEIMILSGASLNPTTNAYFHAGLADRRYNEAESLLLAKQDVASLETFLQEIRETEKSIANVSDLQRKEELKTNLIAKIDEYQSRLTTVQTQIAEQQTGGLTGTGQGEAPQQSIDTQTTDAHIPPPGSTSQQTSSAQNPPAQATIAPQRPTTAPVTATPFAQPTVSQSRPTVTPPVSAPTPTPGSVGEAIDNAKNELEKIKNKEKQQNMFKKDDNDGEKRGGLPRETNSNKANEGKDKQPKNNH